MEIIDTAPNSCEQIKGNISTAVILIFLRLSTQTVDLATETRLSSEYLSQMLSSAWGWALPRRPGPGDDDHDHDDEAQIAIHIPTDGVVL